MMDVVSAHRPDPPAVKGRTMNDRYTRRSLIAATVLVLLAGMSRAGEGTKTAPAVDFNRQVRPILSEYCFACHGPDEKARKGGLRLDTRDGVFGKRKGGPVLVPGKPAESELIARVTTTEPGQVMPPVKATRKPKPHEIKILEQWVAQGAAWNDHWAFVTPRKPALPRPGNASWARGPIDHFIAAHLESEGLKPSAEADRVTLLRRVTLDLTGLPPTPKEVDDFLADKSPDAYEKVVDRLLASPRYAEHMARHWLDNARFGDTHGLHLDNYREIWPYRDWVLNAFGRNLPFDRFVIEQLAGDLLPNATLDQTVATGYNRCHVSTSEGGSIEDEIYVRNVVDQVDTNGTVFMGLSVGCARCHDHKYDPIRMKDYYQLFAFFNSIDGKPLDGNAAQWPPVVKVPTAEQTAKFAGLQKRIDELRAKIAAESAKVKYDDTADAEQSEVVQRADHVWLDDTLPAGAKVQVDGAQNVTWSAVGRPDHVVHSGDRAWRLQAKELQQLVFQDAAPPLKVGEGDVFFAYVFLDPLDPPREIMLQWRTNEWQHRAYWGENLINFGADATPQRRKIGPLPTTGKWVRLEVEAAKVGIKPGTTVNGLAFTQHGGTAYWDRAGLETWTPQDGQAFDNLTAWVRWAKAGGLATLPKPVQDAVKVERAKRTPQQKKLLTEQFVARGWSKTRGILQPLYRQVEQIEAERQALEKTMPTTLVFKEMATPKPAFMLKRGEYDQKGEMVGRDTPAFLPPLPANLPRNRLGFAQWLVSPEHPLTARVAVNRFWQQVFGTGLVKTTEDFGAQGEPPSHPELLDWLAVEFREDGWDVKKFMKRLVTSATYRQSSKLTPELIAKDPANRLLARGPRFRMDAESLRDPALFAGGLLVEKIGGPSVKPPQPGGLWEAVGYVSSNTARFSADRGHDKVHRRSLYTFWKRTAPPPQMAVTDAPSREACTVRRERTNTPLQALLFLNEQQYVEAARALAERTMKEGGTTPESRVVHLFRLAATRSPDAREVSELLKLYREQVAVYAKDEDAAKKLIAVGESKPDTALDPTELAAWTMLGNLVLNLDEVLNKS
jgi:hypothetical protein